MEDKGNLRNRQKVSDLKQAHELVVELSSVCVRHVKM